MSSLYFKPLKNKWFSFLQDNKYSARNLGQYSGMQVTVKKNFIFHRA